MIRMYKKRNNAKNRDPHLNQSKKEKGNVRLYLEIIIGSLTVIIAILAFLYDYYKDNIKVSEADKIRNEILSTINDVENSLLNMASINDRPDTLILKKYQQKVSALCTQWRVLEGTNSFEKIKSQDDQQMILMLGDYLIKKRDYNTVICELFDLLYILQNNDPHFDYSKILSLQERQKEKMLVSQKCWEAMREHALKNDSKGMYQDLEELRKNPEYLKFDLELFKFIRETNSILNKQ